MAKIQERLPGISYLVSIIVRLLWLWHRYPSAGLPAIHVLVVTHSCSCVEIGDSSSFIPFVHDGRLSRGPWLSLKPLVSHRRYASQAIPIQSNTCAQVITGLIKVFQANTITLAHSDGPHIYAEIWENSWKPRFHELQHESKMRGSSTPTPTPLNGEATKPTRNANQKGQEKGPIRKGKKKRQGKPPPYHQEGGGGEKTCRRKSEKQK